MDPTPWILGIALLVSVIVLSGGVFVALNRVPPRPRKGPPPIVDAADLTDDQLAATIAELQAQQRTRTEAR